MVSLPECKLGYESGCNCDECVSRGVRCNSGSGPDRYCIELLKQGNCPRGKTLPDPSTPELEELKHE